MLPPNLETNKKEETQMQASDVKRFGWVGVEDWSALTQSVHTIDDGLYVGFMDIEDFVESVFQESARQLNIPYEELKPVLVEKNAEFYAEKERTFKMYKALYKDHVQLYKLRTMLRIPDISSIPAEMIKSRVEIILDDFAGLSDDEKKEVLQRLGVVRIQI